MKFQFESELFEILVRFYIWRNSVDFSSTFLLIINFLNRHLFIIRTYLHFLFYCCPYGMARLVLVFSLPIQKFIQDFRRCYPVLCLTLSKSVVIKLSCSRHTEESEFFWRHTQICQNGKIDTGTLYNMKFLKNLV
jgi:hypothetical protein